MPELPDVTVYCEAIERRFGGRSLDRFRIASPFVLRSVEPPPRSFEGRRLTGARRLGKRIVLAFDNRFVVIHLMIAGRLREKAAGAVLPRKLGLAALDFGDTSLVLTEAGSKKRASIHLVEGEDALADLDPGGMEVPGSDPERFADRLRARTHTLKRALTDPRIFSGIGNAYSDEILHRARLSPFRRTDQIDDDAVVALHRAAVEVLAEWTDRLRRQVGDGFPDRVTAFHDAMAVHGKHGRPCPVCGAPVQRIVYAANEANYCADCQTGGKLLADRALSRLLRKDWPRSIEELEQHLADRRHP